MRMLLLKPMKSFSDSWSTSWPMVYQHILTQRSIKAVHIAVGIVCTGKTEMKSLLANKKMQANDSFWRGLKGSLQERDLFVKWRKEIGRKEF